MQPSAPPPGIARIRRCFSETVDVTVLSRPDPPLSAPPSENLLRHPLIVLGLVTLGMAVAVLIAELLLRH
jgi:hypothetical protein